jgi:xanthine/uracil permease
MHTFVHVPISSWFKQVSEHPGAMPGFLFLGEGKTHIDPTLSVVAFSLTLSVIELAFGTSHKTPKRFYLTLCSGIITGILCCILIEYLLLYIMFNKYIVY